MRIDLVYPVLPPAINGIGDHTLLLAKALAKAGDEVRLLTRADPGRAPLPPGITAVDVWPEQPDVRTRVGPLVRAIAADPPDAVLVQFEQFSYGARGFNPGFALLFARLRLHRIDAVGVLYAHETYVTPDRLRWLPIWAYQVVQFALLVRTASVVCVAAEAWIGRVSWLGRRAELIPIFANIPVVRGGSSDVGLPDDARVVLWFGYLDARRVPAFDACVTALTDSPGVVLVYAGKDHALAAERLTGRGIDGRIVPHPSPEMLSALLQEADLVVAPFPDGVSGRRSTFLAAIAHGARVLTTIGPSTDSALRSAAEGGVFDAVESADPHVFGNEVRRVVAGLPRRESRWTTASTAAATFYAVGYAPERAAARIEGLVERARGPR